MPAQHSDSGRVDFDLKPEDVDPQGDAEHAAWMRETVTPKPGEEVHIYRNADNGDSSVVIRDANGNVRGRDSFAVTGMSITS